MLVNKLRVKEKNNRKTGVSGIVLMVFALCATYALMRYVLFGNVPAAQIPLYISDKAVSMSGALLLALTYSLGGFNRVSGGALERFMPLRKQLGLAGFSLSALHAAMALTIFSPAYFSKFFLDSGRMTFTGELAFLLGVLTLFNLVIPALTSLPLMERFLGRVAWERSQKFGFYGLLLLAGHVFVMGFGGWVTPEKWQGSLPPITLISFIAVSSVIAFKLTLSFFDKYNIKTHIRKPQQNKIGLNLEEKPVIFPANSDLAG